MYILPVDPQARIASANASANNVNAMQIVDPRALQVFVTNEIIKNLELGKTSLVIIPEGTDPDIISKLLANFKLSNLCLSISNNEAINAKELARLKILAKDTEEKGKPKQYEISKSQAFKSFNELRSSHALLNKEIIGQRSWKSLSLQSQFFQYPEAVDQLKQKLKHIPFQFDASEYWKIRGRIEEAAKSYNIAFDTLENIDCLNPKLYQSQDHTKTIKKIMQLITKCENSLYNINAFTKKYGDAFHERGLEELERVIKKLDFLERIHNSYQVRYDEKLVALSGNFQDKFIGMFSDAHKEKQADVLTLRKAAEDLIQEFNNSQLYHIELTEYNPKALDSEQIEHIIDSAKHCISNWRHNILSHQNDSLKQINVLNSDYPGLKKLDTEIEMLIASINERDLLLNKIENNSLSLLKKQELLTTTIQNLKHAQWLLQENSNYIQWKTILLFLPEPIIKIINALKINPINTWAQIFDEFYHTHMLEVNYSPSMPSQVNSGQIFLHDLTNFRSEALKKISNIWSKKRNQNIEDLKATDKKTFVELFKKNAILNISWMSLVQSNAKMVKSFFPIITIPAHLLPTLSMNPIDFDNTIILNDVVINETQIQALKKVSRRFTAISEDAQIVTNTENLRKLSNSNIVQCHIIDSEYCSYPVPLRMLGMSEKIAAIRSLSRDILNLHPSPRIFHLMDTTIISTVSNEHNKLILELLKENGIKEVRPKQNDMGNCLMDALIDDKKRITMIVEEGLVNPAIVEDYEWQSLKLTEWRDLGIDVLNLWSQDFVFKNRHTSAQKLRSFFKIRSKSIDEPVVV